MALRMNAHSQSMVRDRNIQSDLMFSRCSQKKLIFSYEVVLLLQKLFHLGYKVVRIDRVYFGGLTKKDIPRGRHRFLSDKEVSMLKMI